MTAAIEQLPDNNIINALKTLERAGSDTSRAAFKLTEVADIAGNQICKIIREAGLVAMELPRGYMVRRQHRECNRCRAEDTVYALLRQGQAVNSPGTYHAGDPNCFECHEYGGRIGWPATTRATALAFASDLAGGLLDENTALIMERTQQSQRATEQIRVALEAALAKLSAAE